MVKAILTHTDGYKIDIEKYVSLKEARDAMKEQYEELIPTDGLAPEWNEMSHCDSNEAILYTNGEEVHVWKIVLIQRM